ncbi:MAG: NUDIX hydrolase [Sulfurimonas sp.]|nr:NUDIX hydrolase [Sulfurimonas sp.]
MAKIDLVTNLSDPNYIKPVKIHYTQKEVQKTWEAVISHDSVAILLWHSEKEAFITVKQLRVTVLNTHKIDGYTYELCAGIVDKDASKVQIAKEEILEECGYDIPLESITKITSFYTSVGISGARQTLYFAQCDSSMQVSQGGGIHDEDIEVVYIPLHEAKTFMFDESRHKTPGMMMAFYWFFDNQHTL